MGEHLLPNIPSPDAGEMEACCSGLSRTNSVSSSLTVDSFKDLSVSNADASPGQYIEWTDERHSLYLNSLEASFVKQLHNSMGLLGWRSQANTRLTNSSHNLPAKAHKSSDQFTVLREGCWQKVSFQRNQPLLDCTVDSHVSMENQWISRLRSSGKYHMSTSSDFQEHVNEESQSRANSTSSNGLRRNLEKCHASHSSFQDLVGSSTEVSDQNFVDKDLGEGSSCTSRVKRLKTVPVNSSNNDQIVPIGKSRTHSTDISTDASSKREVGVHKEPLSEDSEKYIFPESGMNFFFRES